MKKGISNEKFNLAKLIDSETLKFDVKNEFLIACKELGDKYIQTIQLKSENLAIKIHPLLQVMPKTKKIA